MTADEFEARVVEWACRQPDVEALVQIGSRIQASTDTDEWSDWDYHLIVSNPARFDHARCLEDIAPCWNAHLERTARGVTKLSMVASGGWEADFVLLPAWQMKIVYWAMAHPGGRRFYPRSLLNGIHGVRLFVRPGYRVLVGGGAWERRLKALAIDWPEHLFTESDFRENLAGFWRHAVWVHKKIMRGEVRAALRWYHDELVERRYVLLAEESRLAGRSSRPEARKAEKWLDARRLEQTAIETSPDQRILARALLAEMALFEDVSRSVAQTKGFKLPDYAPVAAWLRAELSRLA
jgi:hypothetical protein